MNPEALHHTPLETLAPQAEVNQQFDAMMSAEFGGATSEAEMLATQGLMEAVMAMQQLDFAADLDSQDGGSRTADIMAEVNLSTPSFNHEVNVASAQWALDRAAAEQVDRAAYIASTERSLSDKLFDSDDEDTLVGASR